MKIEKWNNDIMFITKTNCIFNLTLIYGKGNEPTNFEDIRLEYLLNPNWEYYIKKEKGE